jgi:hypothetical protein
MSAGNRMVELGRVLATSVTATARAILANLGSLGNDDLDEQGDVANDQPMFTAPGLYCRPLGRVKKEDATGLSPAGVCEVVFIRSADEAFPVGYRDLRLSRVVNPIPGEVGLAQYQGGFFSMRPNADENGTNFLLYGARKDSGGTVVAASSIEINTTSATPQILLQHELGQTLALNKEGGVVLANAANDAYIEVKPDGIALNGNTQIVGAVRELTVGDPGTWQNVALAPDLVNYVQNAGPTIVALMTAINVLAPGTFTPAQIAAMTNAFAPYLGSATTTQSAILKASPFLP